MRHLQTLRVRDMTSSRHIHEDQPFSSHCPSPDSLCRSPMHALLRANALNMSCLPLNRRLFG